MPYFWLLVGPGAITAGFSADPVHDLHQIGNPRARIGKNRAAAQVRRHRLAARSGSRANVGQLGLALGGDHDGDAAISLTRMIDQLAHLSSANSTSTPAIPQIRQRMVGSPESTGGTRLWRPGRQSGATVWLVKGRASGERCVGVVGGLVTACNLVTRGTPEVHLPGLLKPGRRCPGCPALSRSGVRRMSGAGLP